MPKKYIGSHISFTRANPKKTAQEARELGADAVAFFLKPKLAPKAGPLPDETVKIFTTELQKVVPDKSLWLPHGGYTINLASDKADIYNKSIATLKCELAIADQLGVNIVLHPGFSSHKEAGISKIAKSLNEILPEYNAKIIFETMSGKHTKSTMIGNTFEELAALIGKMDDKSRVGVCIDTCHMFVSGYDITTEERFDSVMRQFDRIVGPQYIMGVHVNDSKNELGSGHDRHARVGHGVMGLEAFKFLMNDPHFDDIPMVLERGGEVEDLRAEMALLRSLQKSGK